MRFVTTPVQGAFIIEGEPVVDERGSFARLFCANSFRDAGIHFMPVQTNISRNPVSGTMRGMHFQLKPHEEPKLVQCIRGRIYDVAVDLRPDSNSFCAVAAVELSASIDRIFFIPPGCAHGFLTQEDDSDVLYCMGAAYVAGSCSGVRWDDPAFGILWPTEPRLISPRDAAYPDFTGTAA